MRKMTGSASAVTPEEFMVRITRQRLLEIVLAIVLTIAALLFVTSAWAAEEQEGVAVSDAWARPTIGEGRVTAAYMTITNGSGEDDVLKSAKTPVAKRVELHRTTMSEDGIMQMRPIHDGLPLPAGGTTLLKPGGAHVMIMGLDGALADGEDLPLTLELEKAGSVELVVPVRKQAGGK